MTAADHANTVREALSQFSFQATNPYLADEAVAALDALTAQAETAAGLDADRAMVIRDLHRTRDRITELHATLERTNESYLAAEQAAEQARKVTEQEIEHSHALAESVAEYRRAAEQAHAALQQITEAGFIGEAINIARAALAATKL